LNKQFDVGCADSVRRTYEGSTWLYSFFAPGDMEGVITAMGGPQTFVKRLQHFHESGKSCCHIVEHC